MRHEEIRELCALQLYDELDADEAARLEAHLTGCDECASFARELRAGLGRLADAPPHDDLPAGWRERLAHESLAPWAPARRALPLLPLAASFLAGAALAWGLSAAAGGGPPAGVELELAQGPAAGSTFALPSPPPRARDRGTLGLLARGLQR